MSIALLHKSVKLQLCRISISHEKDFFDLIIARDGKGKIRHSEALLGIHAFLAESPKSRIGGEYRCFAQNKAHETYNIHKRHEKASWKQLKSLESSRKLWISKRICYSDSSRDIHSDIYSDYHSICYSDFESAVFPWIRMRLKSIKCAERFLIICGRNVTVTVTTTVTCTVTKGSIYVFYIYKYI